MIEIRPAYRVRIDVVACHEDFLVCAKDQEGNLNIMGLRRYLVRGGFDRESKCSTAYAVRTRKAVDRSNAKIVPSPGNERWVNLA